MRSRVDEILNRRPAVGLAVGVVRDGSLELFSGHGVADIASNTSVTEDTVFRVGSLTKTFTAIAVMQLEEQRLIDLDGPANDYLRGYRLIPADPRWRPATVRHLLTHTAGIREVLHPWGVIRPLFGETVKAGRPVPSLADYYRPGLRIGAEPGTRFRYTDHGFATLGQIVEDVTGQPFDRYLRERVFAPLGMIDTDLVRSDAARSRLATGYHLRAGGPKPYPDYEVVTAGGAAAYSTPRDMARYLAALLGGGANEHGSVLKPETLAAMFAPQYQPDPRIPGLGLAFFRGNTGGRTVLEHQGVVPAFTSQIFLAPDDGIGLMAFTNGTRTGMFWLPVETERLFNHLLGAPDKAIRTDVPHHPEIWADICGWYYLPGPLTDMRARGMIGAGFEVFVRRGQLFFRCLSPVPALLKGFPLHPDDPKDPYDFRADLREFDLTMRLVFSHEPGGGTTAVHLDVMPLSAQKQGAATNPRRWASGALLALGATAIASRAPLG
ncbi:MAG: serine hydrolase domain-containing protein, partial [Jiangellaceae bacterium]